MPEREPGMCSPPTSGTSGYIVTPDEYLMGENHD
jgi:hypothetical protein